MLDIAVSSLSAVPAIFLMSFCIFNSKIYSVMMQFYTCAILRFSMVSSFFVKLVWQFDDEFTCTLSSHLSMTRSFQYFATVLILTLSILMFFTMLKILLFKIML